MKDREGVTPIIFRKFQRKFHNGEVIALFPYEPGNNDPATFLSFMHVGQHASAYHGIIGRTKPASEVEAHPLIVELTSSPYFYPPLRILRRFPADAYRVRAELVDRSLPRRSLGAVTP
jgi:hypothetical protein